MSKMARQDTPNTAPPRFWIVSEQYYPQETATGYLLTQLAEGLAKQLSVSVLCGKPGRAIVGRDVPQREIRNRVPIRRCATTSLNKDVLFFRLINIATQSISLAAQAFMRVKKHDTLLVVTNPPTLPFLVALVCRIKGAHCVLLIYDVYPEAAIAAGVMNPNSPLVRLIDWLNRLLYRNVRSLVVLGRDMRELVIKKLNSRTPNVVVIPNWADIDQIQPAKCHENSLIHELGLSGKFVVQYAGNMALVNDLESIVQCAEQLREMNDLHFLFIGAGAKRQWLEQTVASKNLSNVTVLPSRPRSDQNNFLNACDVAIVSLNAGMAGVSVPSRTYNIMAAGKPVIGIVEEASEVALLLTEERIGWVTPPGQPATLARAILEAKAYPQQLVDMGQRARSAAERLYTLDRAVEKYGTVFEGLT